MFCIYYIFLLLLSCIIFLTNMRTNLNVLHLLHIPITLYDMRTDDYACVYATILKISFCIFTWPDHPCKNTYMTINDWHVIHVVLLKHRKFSQVCDAREITEIWGTEEREWGKALIGIPLPLWFNFTKNCEEL